MTVATASAPPRGRFNLGWLSTAWLAKGMVSLVYSLYILGKFGSGLATAAALAVADTYVGGRVLEVGFSSPGTNDGHTIGWALSIATSGVVTALWGFIFAKKKLAWLFVLPAVAITGVDVVVDARFVTLRMYGRDVMMNSGFLPPHPTLMWWVLEALVVGITLFSEALIALIFSWLFLELRKLSSGTVTAPANLPELATV